jgi:hypothetical protein
VNDGTLSSNTITSTIIVGPTTPASTTTDMILRDSNNGDYEIYDIGSNAILAAYPLGQVGLEWTVAGFGDFSSRSGETNMLLRATSGPDAGDFEVYDISNNQITFAQEHVGFAATSGPDAGNFKVYDISNNQITTSPPCHRAP